MLVLGFGQGDQGFTTEGPDVVNSLSVHKNGATIAVYAYGTRTEDGSFASLEELVRTALDRMP